MITGSDVESVYYGMVESSEKVVMRMETPSRPMSL